MTPANHEHLIGSTRIDRTFSPVGRRLPHEAVRLNFEALAHLASRTMVLQARQNQDYSAHAEAIASRLNVRLPPHVSGHLLTQAVAANLRGFSAGRSAGIRIMQALPQVSTLFSASWYQPHVMGVLHEFNRLGLPTIEIQHGQQGPFQSMYVGVPRATDPTCSITPSETWLWGRKTQDLLVSGQEGTKSFPIVGYPFLLDTQKYRDQLPFRSQIPETDVLISLQAPHIDTPQEVPLKLVEQFVERGLSVNLRQHPNHRLSKKTLTDISARFGNSVSVTDPSLPFSLIVAGARVNVSGFSSTALEAAALDVPSLLWSKVATSQYGDLIKSGAIIPVHNIPDAAGYATSRQQIDFSPVREYIEPGEAALQRQISRIT